MWRKYLTVFVLAVCFLSTCFLIFELFNPHQLSADQEDIVAIIHRQRELKHNTLTQCLAKSTIVHNTSTLLKTRLSNTERVDTSRSMLCNAGYESRGDGGCSLCPEGTFSLSQWMFCQPRLTCDQILHDVQVSNLLYTIGNWKLYSAEWNSYDVMYAMSSEKDNKIDQSEFPHLLPHENILYPIGFCNERNLINVYAFTETFLGPALELDSVLNRQTGCDNWIVQFHIAIDYVRILTHLHSHTSVGPHVLCNSHTLNILLSQFFITEDLKLLFVPTNNLPLVSRNKQGGLIKCSKKALQDDFVAPEQKWPYHDLKVFNYHQQPGYDEKTDVWKIPDVVKVFLGAGNSDNGRLVLDHLFITHQRCKSFDPVSRPTAGQVLEEYLSVWNLMV